ncbi:UNVERIFIED_CONTAM: Retrovirus-related Pol polyprotein from type-2 retrotransposable element R2DM [Sesamum latifolium]|uniref:Retrovirus-related Pol polyprotein from type-2 retrotransposable element R2DM n=1 Tax=Sesamum latifolium TaxID=2727402 RepID=A0AAW2S2H4_9LAMI
MWEKLLEVGQPLALPWLILGDFNCVKSTTEKQLGVVPTWYELKDFNDCCLSLGLTDATTTGCYYTWYSNSDSNPVWCKLDRVLLNNEWLEAGLHCSAHFNPPGCLSDHSPGCISHISVRAKEADLALQNAQLHLESNPGDAAVRDTLGALRKKAVFLAEAERHFYYQKAKIHFLKMGDRNTKFFHDMALRPRPSRWTATCFEWGPKLSSEHALELCREVTPSEVKQAIFQIHDNKAPGPDGFSACFFKKAWNIVGNQVCKAVTDFFRSGRLLRQLNHCIIALVPKSVHSPTVADYRPISCCNVIYKAITKIIADRLTPVLEHLIDRSQAAFVGRRSITDNIFLAQEMVRQYTRKRISPRCTINVDLRKAFDSVSWTFLSRVLHGYGFPPLFISWIMECVSTSSFSVALNGSLHGFFPGKRGLRQGDPMSPALFLLSMEFFSRLVKRRTSDSEFNFHPKCEKLKITHLLFADDLMLFSRGLPNDVLHGILARTDFVRGEMPVRYLGIPLAAKGFRSPTIPRSWIKLPNLSQNGQLSRYRMRVGWNSFDRLFRGWSVFGFKFSHFQRR